MDERRLRYFLAVVEDGSVTGAARRLHVAQPSLSQALRTFEHELGVELFHRIGRGVRLSAAGKALIGPARQALRAMDDGRQAIAGVLDLRAGTLEIAALATLAVDPMATLVGRYRALHPGVQIRVTEPDTADGVRALVHDGECELGAAHLSAAHAGLHIRSLGEQELLFAMPPQEPDPAPPISARELAQTPLVVSPPGTSTRILLEQTLADVGVIPQIAVETAAREAIIPLVLAGAGAALLPAAIAREAQRRGAVLRRARPPITRPIGLLHRPGPLSAAAQTFLALLDLDDPGKATQPQPG